MADVNPGSVWSEPDTAPAPTPTTPVQLTADSSAADLRRAGYEAFLYASISERAALRASHPSVVSALEGEWNAKMRNPPPTQEPEKEPPALAPDLFRSYDAFLEAPYSVRTAYRAQHPGRLATMEAAFDSKFPKGNRPVFR